MVIKHPQQLQLLHAIASMVVQAAENQVVLHTEHAAARLALQYPHCGMTNDEIENEIIRQVGLAKGIAEIGGDPRGWVPDRALEIEAKKHRSSPSPGRARSSMPR